MTLNKITIEGSKRLEGKIVISGAKNAALPIICSSLLTKSTVEISNCPDLRDINSISELLRELGSTVKFKGESNALEGSKNRSILITANNITKCIAPYEIVRKMRASILVLGPLLSKYGHAEVSLPGGCAIGARPVDLHISALEKMGAKIEINNGYIKAKAPEKGLVGCEFTFSTVSVTATENIMMAATLANGVTTLHNAAMEPEISDLANCLRSMGAIITGDGTPSITITGVSQLNGTKHHLIGDRIEAGTYAIAAAITKGKITLTNISPKYLHSTIQALKDIGLEVSEGDNDFTVEYKGKLKPVELQTLPYPELATDMQAQFMSLLCFANGNSSITENIFENRFMHVPELNRMGANIETSGNTANISSVDKLKGAEVMATDLRASVALVLAGLAAKGKTTVHRIYHLERGYEHIEEKLKNVGAVVIKEKEDLL